MRIAIAGINHETNTYCQEPTPLSAFNRMYGERILRLKGTETSVGGALSACERLGLTPVPIMIAGTQPSGTIKADAYLAMKTDIIEGIRDEAPIDAVFLDLHGAGVVEGCDDLEGDLAAAIRREVGEAIPVTATFDLHGNITQAMADALDGVFACHQYPHIDLHHRANEAIELIKDMIEHAYRPTLSVASLPILMPTTTTFEGIGKDILAEVLAEETGNVIDVSWFHGFPYTDVPQVGIHICVTTREDQAGAEQVAKRVAQRIWDKREQLRATSLTADEAIAAAIAATDKPVVINETSDNCGGGSPGDGTHLLRAMLAAKLDKACFGFIVDPAVAEEAHRAGVGEVIEVSLGGKYDDLHGEPLQLTAYVKALHDGRLTMQAMFKGSRINYGKLARLEVDGMDIIVGSNRSQTFDAEPFLAVGIDVNRMDYIALKSSNHFRGGFQELAGTIITADPPGLTTHHVEVFPRTKAAAPVWPIDDNATYSP